MYPHETVYIFQCRQWVQIRGELCLLTALFLFQTLCTGAYGSPVNELIQMSLKYIGFGKEMREMCMA